MRSVLPLRLASILAFVSFLLHAYLFQLNDPVRGLGDLPSLTAIQNDFFSISGGMLSNYSELYLGYGLFIVLATLIESALLWHLATMEEASRVSMRSMALLVLLAESGYLWLMWQHLPLYPLAVHGGVALLLLLAIFIGGPRARFRAVA